MDPIYLILIFLLSLALFIVLSKKSISIAMFTAALTLGILTLDPIKILEDISKSFLDPKVISLSIATSIIPIIGGLMNELGLLDKMIKNLKISRRLFMGLAPAMIGLLPMPGGALLSAPMVEKIGENGVQKEIIASANVWFRHVFILIYPMSSALIISSEISGLSMYVVIPYLIIYAFLAIFLGYWSFLRRVPKTNGYDEQAKFREFLTPLMILLVAPFIDFSLRTAFHIDSQYSVMIGVITSFSILLVYGKPSPKSFEKTVKRMKPWEFFFLIIAIYVYLYIFLDSGLANLIAETELNKLVLYVAIPFFLGFVTGRVMTPVAILFPIYIAKIGSMSPVFFASTYVAIFMGYIVSPVHPCLVVTADYFNVEVIDIIKRSISQAIIVTLIAALFVLLA